VPLFFTRKTDSPPALPTIVPDPPQKPQKSGRVKQFEESPLFQEIKLDVAREVDEVLKLLGLNRVTLANRMGVQASAVTQSLAPNRGLQLTTLTRMADALDCDLEINFILRGNHGGGIHVS
jgi:hypothetical protein